MFLKFENEIMTKILTEEDKTPDRKLLEQYKNAKVINREYTGHGFYTNYDILDKKYSLGDGVNLTLGTFGANINDLKHGVGFVVFIKNGLISCLEGYTYGEVFPEIIVKYEIISHDK